MTKDELAKVMAETFERLQKVREAGQKEYAHDTSNAFGNFERTGKELDIPREKVLWIFMKKHFDGILAHINGHKSQRESVHGRIDDAHVYLELLRGMIIEDGEPLEKEKIAGGQIPVISKNNLDSFLKGFIALEDLGDRLFWVPVEYTRDLVKNNS